MGDAYVNISAFLEWRAILAARGLDSVNFKDAIDQASGCKSAGLGGVKLSTFVACLERAVKDTRETGLAWGAGISGDYGTRGKVGRAVLGAKTLGVAMRRLSNYYPLVQDATYLKLDVENEWATLSYKILDPDIWPRHEDAMYSLGLYSNLIKTAAPKIWAHAEITIEAVQDAVAMDLSNIVHANVIYGGSVNAVRFPTAALDQRLELAPPVDNAFLSALTRDLVMKRREAPIAERVRQKIFEGINENCITQEFIAAELGLSSRTLRRKLSAEKHCFQGLLDECRMKFAALEFRSRRASSLSDLALKLGYSEHSTFSRAFSRWCGASPQDYRRTMMAH